MRIEELALAAYAVFVVSLVVGVFAQSLTALDVCMWSGLIGTGLVFAAIVRQIRGAL